MCYTIVVPEVANGIIFIIKEWNKQMSKFYDDAFKTKVVHLHLVDGRSIKSLEKEYNVSHGTITLWCRKFKNKCKNDEQLQENYDYRKEILKLNAELEDVKKENYFLKKTLKLLALEIKE